MRNGYRLSANLLLDEDNAIRDAATLQTLGFLSFMDGRKEQLLAGLGATYGTGEDGPLVVTSEELAKVREILTRVGIDPASLNMADDDFPTETDEAEVSREPSEEWLAELFGRSDKDAVTLLAIEALGIVDSWGFVG